MSETSGFPFEKYATGQSVSRLEDPLLLRGEGCFTDDFNLDGQAYGYVFRSPFAHGRIDNLDVSAARASDGVLAVLTAAELDAAGVGTLPCLLPVKNRDGTPLIKPPRPVLATDRVRYRGEAVAFVVAETPAQARDAAERIVLDIETLPAVTDCRVAAREAASQLHVEAPGNQALDWEFGDAEEADRIFAGAHHVTTLTLRNNRVHVSPMEPRAGDLPSFVFDSHPVPATTNPLGAKGCGEAGTNGALPAVMNAVVDALARAAGVTHFDMPATPERVWLALHGRAVVC